MGLLRLRFICMEKMCSFEILVHLEAKKVSYAQYFGCELETEIDVYSILHVRKMNTDMYSLVKTDQKGLFKFCT